MAVFELDFDSRLARLLARHEALLNRPNRPDPEGDSHLVQRYEFPVITASHVPLTWRYDLDRSRNPYLLERLAVNAAFNPGAILWNNKIILVVRVEGADRKSFFAIAESANGIDGFRFWPEPLVMPVGENPETNVYDMRLVAHADGWIYGLFCAERKDPAGRDLSSAIAACGLARTQDLHVWERLPDLLSCSPQQRNVVLHPEFVEGRYGLYTRPQDDFIDAGRGGGIGWALCSDMTRAQIGTEEVIEPRVYHTIKEGKNGLGPAPLKTPQGWLHLAHGVRACAAGLRYVLYCFLTDLHEPWRVTHRPGGYFLAPEGIERIGDVSNVLFANGWIARPDGEVLIYYASSDTRCHVAQTTLPRLLDYVLHTPPDGLKSHLCVQQRLDLIRRNR